MIKKSKPVICITGVGGGVGQSIIKALYSSDYKIVGLDSELLAAGLYSVPIAYKIPYADDDQYIDKLLDICAKVKCKLLFPGLDAELSKLSINRDKFRKAGTTVVVSRPDVINICDDKLLTYNFINKLNLPTVPTYHLPLFLKHSYKIKFPVIIKPKTGGARSKNVFLLKTMKQLKSVITINNLNLNKFVVQQYIKGDEYTCGTINLDNKHLGTIVMRRILRDGDTYKCFIEQNPAIEAIIKKAIYVLKPFGACNVQLRITNNIPYIFEFNARCSGTTAARALAGFNEPHLIADYLIHHKKISYNIKPMTILRYWKELTVSNRNINTLKSNLHITNRNYIPL